MKKLILTLSLLILSTQSFAETKLAGDYTCKRGFLGFIKVDTLSIHTAKSGNLYIYMQDADFKISKDCKVLSDDKINAECAKNNDSLTLEKNEKEYHTEIKTTLSFEKVGSMVIVQEKVNDGHSNDLTVLVCRPL